MRKFLIKLEFYPFYRLPSLGEIDSLDKEALHDYHTAKEADILNEHLWTEIFNTMKFLNSGIRNITTLPIKGTPRPLDPTIFNRSNGVVIYPKLLTHDIYAQNLSILNNKLRDFCCDNQKTYITYAKTQRAIDNLFYQLQDNIAKYQPEEYSNSINFMRSLEYAIRKLI